MTAISGIQCVAFDFGGTLALPGLDPDGRLVASVLAETIGDAVPQDFSTVFDAVYREVTIADRVRAIHTAFFAVLGEAASQVGLTPTAADLSRVAEIVFMRLPDAMVDPHAAEAVRRLHADHLRCVLACDTQRPEAVRRHTLAAAGLADCFAALVLSSAIGVRKPHPRFYTAVVAAAGCVPGEVLFVGDTVSKDVDGPLRSGMRTVLVAPGGCPTVLDARARVIAHVWELVALLGADADAG